MEEEDYQNLIDSIMATQHFVVEKSQHEKDQTFIIVLVSIALVTMIGSFIYLFFGPSRSWNKGKFPAILSYKTKNIHEAMMYLGIELIRRDASKDLKNQMHTLSWFLSKKFSGNQKDHYENLFNSLKFQVKITTVLSWLKAKMPQEHRIEVIDFVTDFAFSNGEITSLEIQFIQYIAKELSIDQADMDLIFYLRLKKYHEDKQKQSKESQSKTTYYSRNELDDALETLGLKSQATWEEVRKRYRSLAKTMHPDLFASMGKEEQNSANERFTAINKAYQILENKMKK